MNNLYFTDTTVVKIVSVYKDTSVGFCLETEKLIQVKNKNLKPVPKSIQAVLKSEKVRYLIARELSSMRSDIGGLLGKTPTTGIRIAVKYDMRQSEIRDLE